MQISTANLQVAAQQTAPGRQPASKPFEPLDFRQQPSAPARPEAQPDMPKPEAPQRPGSLLDIKV